MASKSLVIAVGRTQRHDRQYAGMCTQVRLQGLDEALPLDKEEGSSAHRQQKEQLQRNEFYRDCMAPINAEFKVPPLAS